MKHLTRRQVIAWFQPIRSALMEMKTGYADSINGRVVARLGRSDIYERLDYCLDGCIGCCRRILPQVDLSPLDALKVKLESDSPLVMEDIDAALRLMRSLEKPLMRAPWIAVKDALITEQVAIEMDRIRKGEEGANATSF